MSTGELGILKDSPVRIAQYSDEDYTLYAYDVALDENRRETGRDRMDLTGGTVVYQVKDPTLVELSGVPSGAFTFSTPTVTLTDSTASFSDELVDRFITIAGAPSAGNDGIFRITGVPSSTTLELENASGVAEAQGSATYFISNIVIDKNSSLASQIEIDPDQVTILPTSGKGTSILHLIGADTADLIVGREYWHDAWVHKADGKKKRILKKSRFYVEDGVYEPSVGAPAAIPGAPAPQNERERSFEWVAPTTAKSYVVAIPGNGMVDSNYAVDHTLSDLPSGVFPASYAPKVDRTPTTFGFETDGQGGHTRNWAFSTNATDGWAGGFYEFDSGNDDFSVAATWGTAGKSYAAHVGFVQGAVSANEITIRVTGTSIDDATGETLADTEDIVISAGAANRYFETAKKWNGQVTIVTIAGTAVAFNHGWVKYWDHQNRDFVVTGLEALWDSDSASPGSDIALIHHSSAGWTYQASGGPLHSHVAERSADHTDDDNDLGYGAWKKTGLSVAVNGRNSEGILFHITSAGTGLGSQSFRSLNLGLDYEDDDPIEAGTIVDFHLRDM